MIVPAFLSALVVAAGNTQADNPYRYWPSAEHAAQRDLETALNAVPDPDSLRKYHALIAEEPHPAGTPQDLAAAEKLAESFESLGLDVERHEIWAYLPRPIDAAVEIVWPEHIRLDLKEKPVPGDDYSQHENLSFGWNAYSGNGDVTAEVVYVNYGRKKDFEKLKQLGVDLSGKIVIARYGGNYRGYKAKFAEAGGAVGLIIFTDPGNSGFVRGPMYPDGGYANETSIQRGSILTLDYSGDPLTPFEPATRNARRLNPDNVAFPSIPVQPIGWAAAAKILSRMDGQPAPREWQGGLPFTYSLTSAGGVRVRLMVKQERELRRVVNVVGSLSGKTHPEQKVVVGCHHDAWTFGAGDPLAGTMVVCEAAKSFATAAREGHKPDRTVVFAHWAAEEYGLIGSVEWVEAHREDLSRNAVAYINLDMAAMGPYFGSSAAPPLKPVITDATRAVPAAERIAPNGESVFEEWLARSEDDLLPGHPRFGHLGGGSDHVGFYCHLGIPSASLSVGGSKGVSYHSAYDNLTWYRKVVGDDYQPAVVLTRIVNTLLARLSNSAVLPVEPSRYGNDVREHLDALTDRARDVGLGPDFTDLEAAAKRYEARADQVYRRILRKLAADELSNSEIACVNSLLLRLERRWLTEPGVPGRPWFRSLYAATDESSGYAAWMLPALRYGVEHKDSRVLKKAQRQYLRVFERLNEAIDAMESCVETRHLGR